MRSPGPLAFAVALACATGCATSGRVPATVLLPDGVRFQLSAPTASHVSVAGSFNGWSATAHPMRRDAGGRGPWTTIVRLPTGEHQFMFVVDATEWRAPPEAQAYIDDGFGARNGIVIVRRRAEER